MNPGLLLFFIEVKGSLTVLSLPLPDPFIPEEGGEGLQGPSLAEFGQQRGQKRCCPVGV